jgi:hypothetical protein
MPPATAAQNLGAGLQRPCQGQVFGGLLGAMELTAPARPATPILYLRLYMAFILMLMERKAKTFSQANLQKNQ